MRHSGTATRAAETLNREILNPKPKSSLVVCGSCNCLLGIAKNRPERSGVACPKDWPNLLGSRVWDLGPVMVGLYEGCRL